MENECWSGSNPSPKEVEYFIHNVTDAKDDLMYGLHSIGRSYANHFSEIKLKYKKLALTWLSSLLIGLFFITQSNGSSSLQSLNINKLYLDSMLTILAILGVKLLSFLDVKVYHPQLGSIFIEQIKLEESCKSLEKEYTGMAKLLHSEHFDPIISDSLYYSIIMIIIAFLGVFSLYIKFSNNHEIIYVGLLFGVFAIFIVFEIASVIKSIFFGASREGSAHRSLFTRAIARLFKNKR